jgi:hypothetical protein
VSLFRVTDDGESLICTGCGQEHSLSHYVFLSDVRPGRYYPPEYRYRRLRWFTEEHRQKCLPVERVSVEQGIVVRDRRRFAP